MSNDVQDEPQRCKYRMMMGQTTPEAQMLNDDFPDDLQRLDGKPEHVTESPPISAPTNEGLVQSPPTLANSAATAGSISSYAGILKGCSLGDMSGTVGMSGSVGAANQTLCHYSHDLANKESEKLREIVTATESPPKGVFRFDDDSEFPPVTQKTE
uniref:Uncharacterized protein n=1 Tax=Timema douglasi TaxID=61478 RepID=A0A7R8Z7Y8_TIMDO|nr:unnamed protein product [Timema douglasi]